MAKSIKNIDANPTESTTGITKTERKPMRLLIIPDDVHKRMSVIYASALSIAIRAFATNVEYPQIKFASHYLCDREKIISEACPSDCNYADVSVIGFRCSDSEGMPDGGILAEVWMNERWHFSDNTYDSLFEEYFAELIKVYDIPYDMVQDNGPRNLFEMMVTAETNPLYNNSPHDVYHLIYALANKMVKCFHYMIAEDLNSRREVIDAKLVSSMVMSHSNFTIISLVQFIPTKKVIEHIAPNDKDIIVIRYLMDDNTSVVGFYGKEPGSVGSAYNLLRVDRFLYNIEWDWIVPKEHPIGSIYVISDDCTESKLFDLCDRYNHDFIKLIAE